MPARQPTTTRGATMKSIFAALSLTILVCAFFQPFPAAEAAKFREKILYSFCSRPYSPSCLDGLWPQAGVIDVNGTLFGTTPAGGAGDSGTVFAIDGKTGAERVVYSFCNQGKGVDCVDGEGPDAALIDVNRLLYGTTQSGGNVGCDGQGCGTVFSIDPNTGVEAVLHNFGSAGDGEVLYSGVLDVKGSLFGTSYDGGGNAGLCNAVIVVACGAVFSINRNTGKEKILHSFCGKQNCSDGAGPMGNLIE